MRVKAGDQRAELTFGAIKRNLFRLNQSRSTKWASVNMLAAAWLHKVAGFHSVMKGVKYYQNAVENKISPTTAFKSFEWLTKLEPVA